jgi:RimJ/RimL family protein N-acetyltransferase
MSGQEEQERFKTVFSQLLQPRIVWLDPATLAGEFLCLDGLRFYTRLIQPADAPLLLDLLDHLSVQTQWRRFHAPLTNVPVDRLAAEARRLAAVDNHTGGGAVLALLRDEGGERLIGEARLARPPNQTDSSEAEVAVVVRDDYQGRGVGTILIYLLFKLARRMQVDILTATIQADNRQLFEVLRNLRAPLELHTRHGETAMRLRVEEVDDPSGQEKSGYSQRSDF